MKTTKVWRIGKPLEFNHDLDWTDEHLKKEAKKVYPMFAIRRVLIGLGTYDRAIALYINRKYWTFFRRPAK